MHIETKVAAYPAVADNYLKMAELPGFEMYWPEAARPPRNFPPRSAIRWRRA